MLREPHRKYRPFEPVNLPDRRWPGETLTRAPIWLSTDLRDGNQSLFEPMSADRKLRFFKMLCQIGFKEIEVGFPSASQTEFDFIRQLIEQRHVPDDVTIAVLTPAREELIARTVQSLVGARVPYLPIDPKDLGRTYDSIIRINSQSGKGGVAYLLEHDHGLVLPRRLQVEFSGAVQRQTDLSGGEMSTEALWQLFEQEYLHVCEPLQLLENHLIERGTRQAVRLRVQVEGEPSVREGEGNGPLDAVMAAMGLPIAVQSYEERAIGAGAHARAAACIELTCPTLVTGTRFGVAIHPHIVTASIQALFCGFNRLLRAMATQERQALLSQLRPDQPARQSRRRA